MGEDQRLDTVFQLNVKGMTQFGDDLVVTGLITARADGTITQWYSTSKVLLLARKAAQACFSLLLQRATRQ